MRTLHVEGAVSVARELFHKGGIRLGVFASKAAASRAVREARKAKERGQWKPYRQKMLADRAKKVWRVSDMFQWGINQFGVGIREIYGPIITELSSIGLLKLFNDTLSLTAKGRLLGNEVFQRFL